MDYRDQLADLDEEILIADGFDAAIIGYVTVCGRPPVALYDVEKCVEVLMDEGLTFEEAWEHLEVNTMGAYVGEYTPAFATLFKDDDE